MDLFVNLTSGVDLHLQIRKQIEYYITVGELRVGDRLPPIRELERQLGVNRHTIRRAYLDLEKRGLLRVRRGSGVTVAAGFSSAESRRRAPKIGELIDTTLKKAAAMGCPPIGFSKILKTKALELDHRYPSIAFVECSSPQANDLAMALETHLGQAVIGVDLNAAIKDESAVPESVRYVVVPAFHADQIQGVLRKRDVRILTVRVEVGYRFRSMATKLLPVERPCVILRDQDSKALMPQVVNETLGLGKEIIPVLMSDEKEVKRIINHSDIVFFTAPCRNFVENAVPAGKKKQEILLEFPSDTLDLVMKTTGS